MSGEPLVIKDRDYDFLERNRRRKFQQTSRNPLTEDRSKMKSKQNNKVLAGMKMLAAADQKTIKIKAEGDFIDPLSRLKSKPANPLARVPIKNPLMNNNDRQENETEQNDPLARKVVMAGGAEKQDANKIEEPENQHWEIIRKDFIKIFDLNIRNLNGHVNNPFGSQALSEEKRNKTVSQGGNKYEYDRTAQQKQQVQTIPMKTYIDNLIEMHQKMRKKWNDQDKVGTLQITIQSIKLFADNDQPKFAPYKYVYIMDILDSFSKFVFQRMKKLAFPQYTSEKLKTLTFFDISGANIPESAQEICRNWLRKVSSIRELVPRIYIEAALLPIYYFIDSTKIQQNLMKLSFQSRCIGDYINSVNYSTFILRIGAELLPKEKSHILQMLDDFFYYMKQNQFGQQGVSSDEYLKLFEPFLMTAFRFYSENCSEQEFIELFTIYQSSNQHSEILARIIESFSPELITKYSSEIFLIISSYHMDYKFKMYTVFLPKLSRGIQSTKGGSPIEICNLVWLDLKQVNKVDVFLNILVSFIELINKCFRGYQKTKIFQSIIEKFNDLFAQVDSSSGKNSEIFVKLEQFIKSILTTCDDIREILTIEPFLQFISYFPSQLKYSVSKDVLGMFMEREKVQKITDPIAVHSILQIAKNLNEDEQKQDDPKSIFELLKSFFEKIDFGKDLEQMLNLFTEIRSNFGHINEIVEYVINKASNLTFTARNMITSQKMQKKINGFLQACVAFCYITIPMIESPLSQFKYYVINSQIALLHNLISQSESSFKTALSILVDLPEQMNGKPVDEQTHRELSNMVSYMIVLPDNPENENLHLYSGFLALLNTFKWSHRNGESYKISLIKDLIIYLCVQKQENFPYHIEGVRSNDKLFADSEFKTSVVDNVNILLYKIQEAIPEVVQKNYDQQENRLVVRSICHLINTILMYIEPNKMVKSIISQLVNTINKKCNDLNKDALGRRIIDEIYHLVKQTLQNIDKNAKEVKDFTYLKESLDAILEGAKKK